MTKRLMLVFARGAPVASVIVCLVTADFVSAAVMLLVNLGTTIAWRLRTTANFEIGFNLTMLVAAWSATLGLYDAWTGWDLVIHFAATAYLAVLARIAMARRIFPDLSPVREAWLTVAAGALLCVVWEAMELAGHLWVDSRIYVPPLDTVADIVAGLAGSALVAVVRMRGRQRAQLPA